MSEVAKCAKCSATTVQHCDENNCGYLGAGNGAPACTQCATMHRPDCDTCGAPYATQPELAVWYGKMPESNGKSNWTAILHRKGQCISEGITIARSEYPGRTLYEADEMRYLIGELDKEPEILDYDADSHSGYKPTPAKPQKLVIDWSDPQKPNLDTAAPGTGCGYDHVTATMPFGVFSIEWKSWKEHDSKTCYFNGEYFGNAYTLDEAKEHCRKFYTDKLIAHKTEGFDEPISNEEISEAKATLGTTSEGS